MSIQEGLTSEDYNVVKRARATAQGQITKSTRILNNLLVKDLGRKFIYEEINGQKVDKHEDQLYLALDNFRDTWIWLSSCLNRCSYSRRNS